MKPYSLSFSSRLFDTTADVLQYLEEHNARYTVKVIDTLTSNITETYRVKDKGAAFEKMAEILGDDYLSDWHYYYPRNHALNIKVFMHETEYYCTPEG